MRLENQVIPTRNGSCAIEFTRPGFPWGADVFSRFLPADEFQVRGLRERVRMHGLGVPLIAFRNAGMLPAPIEKHMGRGLKLPATALLRFEGNLESLASGNMRAALELYLSTDTETVTIAGQQVPLEGDVTAALAYSLEESKIWGFSFSGFFSGRTQEYPPGVYMLQPYQPGKIPIVLVHGTASNPATWAQLINALMLDPQICTRYQFWLAMYNTGNPVLFSAAEVRDSFVELVHTLDPSGADAALAQAVLVGHSQGGLIARLLVSSSGDRIWSGATQEPFDTYPLKDEDRELLRRCLFFEPLPGVQRVVFLATPHRGSYVAGGLLGQLARGLVSLPSELANIGSDRPGAKLPPELRKGIPTSVENMNPDSRFVRILDTLPFAQGLHIHSIVAIQGSGPVASGDDGMVEYSSAHLEEAESEFIVRSGHSVQNAPAAALELRRILLEHLRGKGP
jgi:pimeloyl-ACP methyl ester carboxylesterase